MRCFGESRCDIAIEPNRGQSRSLSPILASVILRLKHPIAGDGRVVGVPSRHVASAIWLGSGSESLNNTPSVSAVLFPVAAEPLPASARSRSFSRLCLHPLRSFNMAISISNIILLAASLAGAVVAQLPAECATQTDGTVLCTYDEPATAYTFTPPLGVLSLRFRCVGGTGGVPDAHLAQTDDSQGSQEDGGFQAGGIGTSAAATFLTATGVSYNIFIGSNGGRGVNNGANAGGAGGAVAATSTQIGPGGNGGSNPLQPGAGGGSGSYIATNTGVVDIAAGGGGGATLFKSPSSSSRDATASGLPSGIVSPD